MSRFYPFCTPTITTTTGHCHLSQSVLPSSHCLPRPSCSSGFLCYARPIQPPAVSQPSPPAPSCACAGRARRAETKPGPPLEPETHPQNAVRTLQAGEAWGGALGVLVSRPARSGPCRRPGACSVASLSTLGDAVSVQSLAKSESFPLKISGQLWRVGSRLDQTSLTQPRGYVHYCWCKTDWL